LYQYWQIRKRTMDGHPTSKWPTSQVLETRVAGCAASGLKIHPPLPVSVAAVYTRAMADTEHVTKLKESVEAWNVWRRNNFFEIPKLKRADLAGADLRKANLEDADLSSADLRGADLSGTDLSHANLSHADLRKTNLSGANLYGVKLYGANLEGANLSDAHLMLTNFTNVTLSEAKFGKASFHQTIFCNCELSGIIDLDRVDHIGPSSIDYRTLEQSGQLPINFLRGVGLPDRMIEYLPSIFDQAIQFYSCFISYSSKDDEFPRRLHADLQDAGVRCWFAPEDLKIGDRMVDTIGHAIRVRDKLVLLMSEDAIASEWVEREVNRGLAEEARRREETGKKQTVLFPITIDDTAFKTDEEWAMLIKDDRNIGDFRQWKDHDAYKTAFDRLLRDLKQDG
jgi:hypothetical protein